MKKLLLYVYENTDLIELVKEIQKMYSKVRLNAISVKDYQGQQSHFEDAENRLVTAIRSKLKRPALHALNDLRNLYEAYGEAPTELISGRYEMIHFLNEIDEFVVIVSWGNNSGWE